MDHNNKKLLDLWTQCVTESTDGTDESGSKHEVKTNRDKNSAESEVREQLPHQNLKKTNAQHGKGRSIGVISWKMDQFDVSIDVKK